MLFQGMVDLQYEIVETVEMHPCAEDMPEEKQTVEFAAEIKKTNVSSEESISKRFDVVTDCLDHHFVKENGHESVMQLLKLSQ